MSDGWETDPECANGRDDDGNGFSDYPADRGCSSRADDDEGPTGHNCGDGADNDDDGLIDFPADPGCTSALDRFESDA